jgi:hypothetical protein
MDSGLRPVRRATSSVTDAQRPCRTDSNMLENAYIHHGSSPAAAISAHGLLGGGGHGGQGGLGDLLGGLLGGGRR